MNEKIKLKRILILVILLAAAATGFFLAAQALDRQDQTVLNRWTAPPTSGQPPMDLEIIEPNATGPLILTEFGDFQCPHCARFALGTAPLLRQEMIDTGMIQFEYRHYPFLGPESFRAAEASECARDQLQFHQYHDELYRMLAEGENHSSENLDRAARELGLNMLEFSQCVKNRIHENRVLQDRNYGRNLGVRGTPSLFLDGQPIEWRTYADLREKIITQVTRRRNTNTSQNETPQPRLNSGP